MKAKLMDQLRTALRARHYSRNTEQAYCMWVKRYIYFHKVRHPAEMAEAEINTFLTHLALDLKVTASTQNQALGLDGLNHINKRLHPMPAYRKFLHIRRV